MQCPACRETIKSHALVCRFCGRAIPDAVRARDSLGQVAWFFGSIVGLVLLVKGCADLASRPAPVAAAGQPARFVDAGECDSLLKGFRRAGLIGKVRHAEIWVDDGLWSRLDLDAKRGVLGAALCVDHMGRVDTGAAYAYSSFTGRQLAHYQPDGFGLTIDAP